MGIYLPNMIKCSPLDYVQLWNNQTQSIFSTEFDWFGLLIKKYSEKRSQGDWNEWSHVVSTVCRIWEAYLISYIFLNFQKLVVKPDQLIKRRGKLGLIKVNVNLQEAKKWIDERMGKNIQVSVCSTVPILGKSFVTNCDIFPCDHFHSILAMTNCLEISCLIVTFFIVVLFTLHASP